MRSRRRQLTLLTGATTIAALAWATPGSAGPSPSGSIPDDSAGEHSAAHETATQAVDGSADASSPEAEEFCVAAVAAEAAVLSEDPDAIGRAFDAIVAAAPADIAATVETVIATAESEGPEFATAYAEMITFMKANCGYAELDVAGSNYAFGGLPDEVAAGPTIVTFENIGTEVHEMIVVRIHDDVTESLDELLALPEEEAETMTTFIGIAFAFPGDTAYALLDLSPGRYAALCFLPEGAAPEVISQMDGPESSTPPGVELGPPHFVLGMVHEFDVA